MESTVGVVSQHCEYKHLRPATLKPSAIQKGRLKILIMPQNFMLSNFECFLRGASHTADARQPVIRVIAGGRDQSQRSLVVYGPHLIELDRFLAPWSILTNTQAIRT